MGYVGISQVCWVCEALHGGPQTEVSGREGFASSLVSCSILFQFWAWLPLLKPFLPAQVSYGELVPILKTQVH